MGRKHPKGEAVEIPELVDYEDDAIAVALMRLGPRARVVLERAAELARSGFDPHHDRLLYEPEAAPPARSRSRAGSSGGDAGAHFLADLFETLAKGARREAGRRG